MCRDIFGKRRGCKVMTMLVKTKIRFKRKKRVMTRDRKQTKLSFETSPETGDLIADVSDQKKPRGPAGNGHFFS